MGIFANIFGDFGHPYDLLASGGAFSDYQNYMNSLQAERAAEMIDFIQKNGRMKKLRELQEECNPEYKREETFYFSKLEETVEDKFYRKLLTNE